MNATVREFSWERGAEDVGRASGFLAKPNDMLPPLDGLRIQAVDQFNTARFI